MKSEEIKSAVRRTLAVFGSDDEMSIAVHPGMKVRKDGPLLKEIRTALGVQQSEISKIIGITQSGISQNEKKESLSSSFVGDFMNAVGLSSLEFTFLKYVLPVLDESLEEFINDQDAIHKLNAAQAEQKKQSRANKIKQLYDSCEKLTYENIGRVQDYVNLLLMAQK